MRFSFRKITPSKDDVLDKALLDMSELAQEGAAALALLPPMTLVEWQTIEAAFCDQVIANVKTSWRDKGQSEAFMQAILSPLEKRFRKSFHERLYSVVSIAEGQV